MIVHQDITGSYSSMADSHAMQELYGVRQETEQL